MLLATLGYHGMTIAEVTGMGRRERFPINWMSKGFGGSTKTENRIGCQ